MNSTKIKALERKARRRPRPGRVGNVVKRLPTGGYRLTDGSEVDTLAAVEFANPGAPVIVLDR